VKTCAGGLRARSPQSAPFPKLEHLCYNNFVSLLFRLSSRIPRIYFLVPMSLLSTHSQSPTANPPPASVRSLPRAQAKGPQSSVRTRGAQPRNTNARTHGLYSHGSPLYTLRSSLRCLRSVPLDQTSARQILQQICPLKALLEPMILGDLNTGSYCTVLRLSSSLSSLTLRAYYVLGIDQAELKKAARSATGLICWDFYDRYRLRLPVVQRHYQRALTHSFRAEARKSAQKSSVPSDGLFLNDDQWVLLAHLFPEESKPSSRGRPRLGSRLALSAILWKLSRAVPWTGLPAGFPPQQTCRRYCSRWMKDGRMLLVWKLLHRDLLTRGPTHLRDLVDQNLFALNPTRRFEIRPGQSPSWQANTGLLFLQAGYKLLRRIRRRLKNPCFPNLPGSLMLPHPSNNRMQPRVRTAVLSLSKHSVRNRAHPNPRCAVPNSVLGLPTIGLSGY